MYAKLRRRTIIVKESDRLTTVENSFLHKKQQLSRIQTLFEKGVTKRVLRRKPSPFSPTYKIYSNNSLTKLKSMLRKNSKNQGLVPVCNTIVYPLHPCALLFSLHTKLLTVAIFFIFWFRSYKEKVNSEYGIHRVDNL